MQKKVKKYIDENKEKPIKRSYLGSWLSHQQQNNKNNDKIMKNTNIKNLWFEFKNNYKEYFIENDQIWNKNLDDLKDYLDKFYKRP